MLSELNYCPKCGRKLMDLTNQKGDCYRLFCHWCGYSSKP